MQVTFSNVVELQKRIAQLGILVSKKANEKVYAHVRVFTENEKVRVTGIDIDSSLTVTIKEAKADGQFDIVVPYDRLSGAVALLPNPKGVVKLSYDDKSKATISAPKLKRGIFSAVMPTFPVEKFVELNVVQAIGNRPELGGFEIGLPGLKEQIDQVDFVIPAADGKFTTSVAQIESTADAFRLVATDGVRLAMSETPANLGEFITLISKSALALVTKLDGGSTVTIYEGDGLFYFVTELETLTYSRTHGEFPPYQTVLPNLDMKYPTVITIKDAGQKEDLLQSLRRCKPFADSEKPGAKFIIEENGTLLHLDVVHNEQGTAEGSVFTNMAADEVEVDSKGAAASVKMDIDLLLPFLERAKVPFTMFIKGETALVEYHANGVVAGRPAYRFLQMPMRS